MQSRGRVGRGQARKLAEGFVDTVRTLTFSLGGRGAVRGSGAEEGHHLTYFKGSLTSLWGGQVCNQETTVVLQVRQESGLNPDGGSRGVTSG